MAEDIVKPDDPISKKIRKRYDINLLSWRRRRSAIEQLRAFVAGDRFKNQSDDYNKDRRLIQIKGQEIQDTTRHIMGETTKEPRNIEALPVDHDTDPEMGEVAASLCAWELDDPWKGFDEEFEAALLACRQSRIGLVWLDWEPDMGPYGELLFRYGDGKRVMWDDSFPEPHHPMNKWVIEELRMDLVKAREKYKADWLQSDREITNIRTRADQPLLPATLDDLVTSAYRDDKCTILRYWSRDDDTPASKTKPGDFVPFDHPDKNYLRCVSGCGYRSETQGQLNENVQDGGEPHTLPTYMAQGCPTCGGDLDLVEGTKQEFEVRAYSQGKRLVEIAAYQRNPDEDKPLADGGWPIPTLRSFPLMYLTAYQSPGEPVGACDTDLMWDQQIASDQLATCAIQAVFEHRPYFVTPKKGITDARDERFEFRDDQFNIAYRDDSEDMLRGKPSMEVFSGPGLDPGFTLAWNMIQQKLEKRTGVADFGLTEENSKDIPATTVAQLTQQQNIPIAHFKRRVFRQLGKFVGILWDAIRYTYTAQRIARLKINNMDLVANLSGDELPNFDFRLSVNPQFGGLEEARQKAFDQAMGLVQSGAPIEMIEAWGRWHEIPPSVLKDVLQAAQIMQAKMQEQQAATMGGPVPGGGAPGMSGPPPPNAGQMTPGMVPGAAA